MRVCVCVSVCEREYVCVCVCVCVSEREIMCVRERGGRRRERVGHAQRRRRAVPQQPEIARFRPK